MDKELLKYPPNVKLWQGYIRVLKIWKAISWDKQWLWSSLNITEDTGNTTKSTNNTKTIHTVYFLKLITALPLLSPTEHPPREIHDVKLSVATPVAQKTLPVGVPIKTVEGFLLEIFDTLLGTSWWFQPSWKYARQNWVKRNYLNRKCIWTNHWSSGDQPLVFQGVRESYLVQ